MTILPTGLAFSSIMSVISMTCQHDVARLGRSRQSLYDSLPRDATHLRSSTMPSRADDPITQAEHEHYHSPVYAAAGAGIMR